MNKSILLLLIFATFSLSAQTVIPKGGLSLASVNFPTEGNERISSKIGFTIGTGLEFNINENLAFQPELLFVRKGYKAEFIESGVNFKESAEEKVGITYLEVPVLIKYYFGSDRKFYVNAGPSFGFGLGGKYRNEYSYEEPGVLETESGEGKVKFGQEPANNQMRDRYFDNGTDIGIQVGGGVFLMNKIMVDLRYGLGLTDLFDKAPNFDNTSRNRAIQLTVGFPFSIN